MRRRRVTFYGHIKRMNEERLTKNTRIKEVRNDMAEMKIDGEEVERRKEFREKIRWFRGFQVQEKKKKTETKWTEERREQHSERMKEYSKKRKNGEK
ncbi:hypothetical protein RI129_008806 [Pyrocoelia pectoralis]|uniref:Uncharacterized protein n=1 Tax=Pyrocoelia pectoralis TaxID=417401 RepID=A0AAN7VAI3_9COLE